MSESKKDVIERESRVTKKGVLETIGIVVLLLVILCALDNIFQSKAGSSYILAGQVNPEQHYDVIFAGSSHMNNAVYPMELWEKYGFTSFNNAQSGEIIPVSYYTCKAAIERYDPQILVLDVYMLYHSRKDGSISWMHQSLDLLPNKYRIPAILDLVPMKNWEEFLFPFSLYHSRWKELSKSDFQRSDTVLKGCAQNFTLAEDITGLTFEYQAPDEKVKPPEVPLCYLDKIVELCEETDTQLVLVALPYFISQKVEKPTHDLSNDQAYFNWLADYAQEKDIPYINFFHKIEDIGFDWAKCLYNYSHMNYWGGTIITDNIGAYLAEHFTLPDRRNDPTYSSWNDDLVEYNEKIQKALSATS